MIHSKDYILQLINRLEENRASDLESETLEFKEWTSNFRVLYKMLVEYAVCFANQKGGTLVLGVKDNIKGMNKAITGCVGFNISEIKTRIYEATDPKILVNVEELYINELDKTLLLVHIPSGIGLHTTTDGKAKIRIGKDCKPLTGSMRQQRMIEIGMTDISSQIIKRLSYNAFDKIEIERLRRILETQSPKSQYLILGEKEFLEQIGITKGYSPTFAGLLLVGKREVLGEVLPSHEVIYLRLKSDIDYDLRKDFKEGILFVLEEIEKNIEVFNRVTTLEIGLFNIEIKDFPRDTYREAILNAILHRDYTKTEPVFIKHYSDRMEISNPGGFISGITPENILRQDSKPRNKYLADILRKIGLIEKAGMGVKRIFYTQLVSGKDIPVYQSDGESVKLIIKNGAIDENFVRFIKEKQKDGVDIGLDELIILSVLRRKKEISLDDGLKALQLDVDRTKVILNLMVSRGLLEKSGRIKGLIYRLSGQVYKRLGESIEYIRHRGIDEFRHPELIMEFLKKYKKITNSQVRELLGIDRNKAFRILKKLANENKIKKSGKGRGAYYELE